jgi:hypothetical protein
MGAIFNGDYGMTTKDHFIKLEEAGHTIEEGFGGSYMESDPDLDNILEEQRIADLEYQMRQESAF